MIEISFIVALLIASGQCDITAPSNEVRTVVEQTSTINVDNWDDDLKNSYLNVQNQLDVVTSGGDTYVFSVVLLDAVTDFSKRCTADVMTTNRNNVVNNDVLTVLKSYERLISKCEGDTEEEKRKIKYCSGILGTLLKILEKLLGGLLKLVGGVLNGLSCLLVEVGHLLTHLVGGVLELVGGLLDALGHLLGGLLGGHGHKEHDGHDGNIDISIIIGRLEECEKKADGDLKVEIKKIHDTLIILIRSNGGSEVLIKIAELRDHCNKAKRLAGGNQDVIEVITIIIKLCDRITDDDKLKRTITSSGDNQSAGSNEVYDRLRDDEEFETVLRDLLATLDDVERSNSNGSGTPGFIGCLFNALLDD